MLLLLLLSPRLVVTNMRCYCRVHLLRLVGRLLGLVGGISGWLLLLLLLGVLLGGVARGQRGSYSRRS
jgi:hypothetical protein